MFFTVLFSFCLHNHSNDCEEKPSSSEPADYTSEIPELTKALDLASVTSRILLALQSFSGTSELSIEDTSLDLSEAFPFPGEISPFFNHFK